MFRFFALVILFSSGVCYAQVNDDFSDGDFTSSPAWSGTTEKFMVNANYALQLNAQPEVSEAWLFTPSRAVVNAEWNCHVILDFNPSSNNFTRIYLAADAASPSEMQNAVFVEIGLSTDDICLYSLNAGVKTKLINGEDDRVDTSKIDVRISVVRKGDVWTLKSDLGAGMVVEGECTFSPAFSSAYFGFYCKYTSTRCAKFYFDDIVVTGDPFAGINIPKRFDLVFSEIMPDPSPSAGLPESEYIEIFNRSQEPVNLAGWKLMVNDKLSVLDGYDLQPGNYVLLVPQSKEDEWKNIGNKLALQHWKALSNERCNLAIFSDKGSVVDALQFSLNEWSDGSFKQDGGWSFERVDLNNMSGSPENWIYSVDPDGGTPGNENSVKNTLPDKVQPGIKMIVYEDRQKIKMHFSEPMNFLDGDLTSRFRVKGNSVFVKNVYPDTVFLDNCTIEFKEKMVINEVYEFTGIDIPDLAGNKLFLNAVRFFGRPDTISLSDKDILINEVLFNPRPGGYDFVELFNRSKKIFNVHDLYLAQSDDNNVITKLFSLSVGNRLFFPGDYLVFTLSAAGIAAEYHCPVPEHLHSIESFPSMPDKQGTVTISTHDGKIIDRLHYNSSMQFPLLNDAEGVSLERISPDMETDDPENWSSASADCGYATPTGKNSQAKELNNSELNGFSIEEELFTPDGDGNTDQLMISYSFDRNETVATITVYNAKGIPVKMLANNKLLGTKGFITWDGTDDDGKFVPPGIYLILTTCYNLSGGKTIQKLTCVVGTRPDM